MTKKLGGVVRKGDPFDKFAKDKKNGEFEKPGPTVDPEGMGIAAAISKIKGREKTGFVLNWLPAWAKKAGLQPFSFFYFEDGFAVDSFNRDRKEMDALEDDLKPEQRAQVMKKTALCSEKGISYLALGPDDDLEPTQIAAKIGRTTFKKGKGSGQVSMATAGVANDGFSEEDA